MRAMRHIKEYQNRNHYNYPKETVTFKVVVYSIAVVLGFFAGYFANYLVL